MFLIQKNIDFKKLNFFVFCLAFLPDKGYYSQALWRWRLSSVGRASALQAEGQRFEPVSLHHLADLAQLVEQLTCNQ